MIRTFIAVTMSFTVEGESDQQLMVIRRRFVREIPSSAREYKRRQSVVIWPTLNGNYLDSAQKEELDSACTFPIQYVIHGTPNNGLPESYLLACSASHANRERLEHHVGELQQLGFDEVSPVQGMAALLYDLLTDNTETTRTTE